MDVLAGYRSNAVAGLDEVSKLIGLPGKIGIGGDKILDTYYQGKFEEIRNYCDVDALNTYLIYIRFQLIEGKYTKRRISTRARARETVVRPMWQVSSDRIPNGLELSYFITFCFCF